MPIYEYECTACAHRFERKQSMSDEPVRACPRCGGVPRRLFSPVGIIFKGSGFYITDNRKPDSSEARDNGKEKVSTTEAKDKEK
jgi:putative FmdB family regulatory protein